MFYQPKTVQEALERKAELAERGLFIAGGTDLVVPMNHGKAAPPNFIDLTHIKSLPTVRKVEGRWELGGNVTFAQCVNMPIRCLAQAALSVGGPGIRELGTLGGNLATASPAGDGSTALLALDAQVELASIQRKRRLSLDQFFLNYRKTTLTADELIKKIIIPTGYRTDWAKVGKRGAVNISIVAAAVSITPEHGARIALASVAPTPMRCYQAETFLARNGFSPDAIRQASEIVRNEVKPITDHRASSDYKTHLSGVLVRRLLENLTRT